MMNRFIGLTVLVAMVCSVSAEERVLEPIKDTFGRSNQRNRNNGAHPQLLVVENPMARSIISFDLAGITNKIIGAEFQFHQDKDGELWEPIDLVIAPMAHTPGNTIWKEGRGNTGTRGQNAMAGEATFSWRSFRDQAWQSKDKQAVSGLGDARLWLSPLASLKRLEWKQGEWVKVTFSDMDVLEEVRESDEPILTIGMWGTAGSGFYFFGSKESGNPPKLILKLEEPEEE